MLQHRYVPVLPFHARHTRHIHGCHPLPPQSKLEKVGRLKFECDSLKKQLHVMEAKVADANRCEAAKAAKLAQAEADARRLSAEAGDERAKALEALSAALASADQWRARCGDLAAELLTAQASLQQAAKQHEGETAVLSQRLRACESERDTLSSQCVLQRDELRALQALTATQSEQLAACRQASGKAQVRAGA